MTLPGGGREEGVGVPPPRSRRLRSLEAQLSERDLAILSDLGRLRLLTGRHIERLHFHHGSPLTSARKTRSSLQRLYVQGLIVRLDRRIGGIRSGSSGYVYALSADGQRLTQQRGPAGGTRLRRPWEPSQLFTDHILAVSELYVSMQERHREGACELMGFEAEPACWRSWHGYGGEQRHVKPDAFVHVGVGDHEALCFVEVDRGTESLTVIRRKGQAFVDYWRTGIEQEHAGIFPSVLWLTTSARRQEQIIEALARLEPEAWKLFRVDQLTRGADVLIDNINQP